MVKKLTKLKLLVIIVLGLSLVAGGGFAAGYWWLQQSGQLPSLLSSPTANQETEFVREVFTLIQNDYWDKIEEPKLVELYMLAIGQVYGPQSELKTKDLQSLLENYDQLIKQHPDQNHAELAASVNDLVLRNLQPANRSMIYTEKNAEDLEKQVANIDSDTDLFATLDVAPDASASAVEQAYESKVAEIESTATDSATKTEMLAEAERAYETIGNEENRERYSETKVEPTIYGKNLGNNISYVKVKQFSPTTIEDLDQILQKLGANPDSNSLILDLRANIGGAIDGLPYLLGPFIGPNQYAYQFFSKGETHDFKTKSTKLPSLEQFKKVVVLIDGETQSSAEVMAATFKKYRVGVLVGASTKGWGTVERVFPLEHQPAESVKYSVFLVHNLTLDEAGEPIEGKGVTPDIELSNANWQEQLLGYFSDQDLIKAAVSVVEKK